MVPVDAELLAGRPHRAVFLPTAAAEEGRERVRYWIDLGTAHYSAMGVEPVPARGARPGGRRATRARFAGGRGGPRVPLRRQPRLPRPHARGHRRLAGDPRGLAFGRRPRRLLGRRLRAEPDRRRLPHPGRYGGEGLAVVPSSSCCRTSTDSSIGCPGLVDRDARPDPARCRARRHRRGDRPRYGQRRLHRPRQAVGLAHRRRRAAGLGSALARPCELPAAAPQ